jgi:hypothetical protein
MMIFSLFSKSFSNNFDIIGSKDIGLYDVVSWGGLPGLPPSTVEVHISGEMMR